MRSRSSAAAIALAVIITACTPAGDEARPSETTGDPVLESRELLGDPLLALAESTVAMADGVDAARHTVPRGAEMLAAVRALREDVAVIEEAAAAAAQAAADAPVEEAAAIVDDAVEAARRTASSAPREIGFLRRVAAIDAALLKAAGHWDRPGSQSEIRARLDRVARRVARLRRPAADLQPAPPRCTTMKRNRRQWVNTVHRRTQQLQGQANSAGGAEFDRLRASFRALPFAVEPRTADRADRRCWRDTSAVAAGGVALREAVDALREALND